MSGVKESVNQIWGDMLIAVVGKLWLDSNKKIFRGGSGNHIEIFPKAKTHLHLYI